MNADNALIEMISDLKGRDIYELVSEAECARAMRVYRSGRILDVRWSEDGETLYVDVLGSSGSATYDVAFFRERGALNYHCPCPAFGRYSESCKHVAAALFTICHVLKPSRFRPGPYTEDRREELKQSLGGAGTSKTQGPAAPDEVLLKPAGIGMYRLDSRRRLPGWARAGRLQDWTMRPGARAEQDEKLLDWVQTKAGDGRLRVMVDDKPVKVNGVHPEPMTWVVNADARKKDVSFSLDVMDAENRVHSSVVQCSEHVAFQPGSGTLIWIPDPSALGPVFDLWEHVNMRDSSLKPRSFSFPAPASVVLPYDPEWFFCLTNVLAVLHFYGGLMLHVEGHPATPEEEEPRHAVHIESESEYAEITILTALANEHSPWTDAVSNLESEKFYRRPMRRIMRSSKRAKALQEAENDIYLAPSEKEARAVVKALAEEEWVRQVQGKTALKRYLNYLIKNLAEETDALLPGRMDGNPVWKECIFRLHTVARIYGLVRRAFHVPPKDADAGGLLIPLSALAEGLPPLASACRELGVDVVFNGAQTRSVPLSLSVRMDAGKDLDWFELHPQVKAEGLELAQEDWEKIIRGELLQDAERRLILPDTDSVEALRKVRSLMGSRPPSAANTAGHEPLQVPRLHIFDWLALERAGVELKLPAADRKVLKSLREFKGLRTIKTPPDLTATLRPYQQTGLNWLGFLYRHRFGACLADDMGLGKTLQAIAFLAAIQKKTIPGVKASDRRLPHLIVVPPSLLYNWQHEIQQFCPALKVVEYTGKDRALSNEPGEVILTTYDLVRRDITTLSEQAFHVAIFDETQYLKNERSRRSRAAQQLNARFRLCLTGTPLENHVGEYFNIMELALPGLLEDARPFTKAAGGEDEERYVGRTRPFILRRTKAEILKDLPPKHESDVYLSMTRGQKELYTRTIGEVREQVLEAYADKSPGQAGILALSALTRLRQICVSPALIDPTSREVSPKLDHLQSRLVELKEEGHAALVFSQFTRALDLIEPVLAQAGLAFVRLDGKTPAAKRKDRIQKFQTQEGPTVFLISLKAGGVGLNLTRASYVFHVDPWWNPAVESQASDRAHRIGQKNQVTVNRILMHHSIEEKLMALKARKREVFESVVEFRQKKSGGAILSKEDFDFLLS